MPKQKSHSGAKKRFRVTKNGKVLHRRQNRSHLLEKKSAERKRRLHEDGQLQGGDKTRVKRMLRGQ